VSAVSYLSDRSVGFARNALIQGQDREAAFRAFEAATLWAVRRPPSQVSLFLGFVCVDHLAGK